MYFVLKHKNDPLHFIALDYFSWKKPTFRCHRIKNHSVKTHTPLFDDTDNSENEVYDCHHFNCCLLPKDQQIEF